MCSALCVSRHWKVVDETVDKGVQQVIISMDSLFGSSCWHNVEVQV